MHFWGQLEMTQRLQYNIQVKAEMYKHKIIYILNPFTLEDLTVRQRLREERGLQSQFTTYTFPENSEFTQTQSDLDELSPPSSSPEWCIVQEQNDWEIDYFVNGPYYYDMDSLDQALTLQAEKRNKLEQMNAVYTQKMGAFSGEEGASGRSVKFQEFLKIKSFFQEQSPFQIKDVQQRLQAVNFKC